jgi:hypothetical protein
MVNCVAAGFRWPIMAKGSEPFTFCTVPLTEAVAPDTILLWGVLLEIRAVVTPFSTEVPVALSEKLGFYVMLRVTTSAPYKLLFCVPVKVPFLGAIVYPTKDTTPFD